MLDYDGTLADFRVDRHEARPSAECQRALSALTRMPGVTLAIFSGRSIGEIQRLLGALPVNWVGEDGWERQSARGVVERASLPSVAVAAIEQAHRVASRRPWAHLVERKRSALVLHTRGLSEMLARSTEAECQREWLPLVEPGAIELAPLNGGVVLRAAARDKALAAYGLLCRMPRGTVALYVGDDDDDEPVFRLVRDHGFGLRVGEEVRTTFATARLPNSAAVTELLWAICHGEGMGA